MRRAPLDPLYLKCHKVKKKFKTHSIWKKGIPVSFHMASLWSPQTQMVNDSKTQEVLERPTDSNYNYSYIRQGTKSIL